MNVWALPYSFVRRDNLSALTLAVLLVWAVPATAQEPEPRPKNVNGVVRDLRGQPVVDAHVFIRDTETNIIRTLNTNDDGLYSIRGLPWDADYEVYAEFRGKESEKKVVSSFLPRQDNTLNFDLDLVVIAVEIPDGDDDDPEFETFDLVQIRGSFDLPTGIPAPIPAVLLLHGYGETRSVWEDLKNRLLVDGWAVMAIDLRGHGRSTTRNQEPITPAPEWRQDARQFPLDVEPALDWLQSQPRVNASRIVVIGSEVGANLALIAGGRYAEVATVVAINPNLPDALALAGTAQNFSPRSTHLIVGDVAVGNRIRNYVTGASRITTQPSNGGTVRWLAAPRAIDEILRWLRDVY